jgi:ElaB/YqjD/DUF883 family membrane-anchored ribosome-binding protein
VSSTEDARKQVEEARQRLVGTVGEIGAAIDETKAEVQQKAKRAAPIAAGVAGAFILLKVLRKGLRRRR